MISKSKRSPYRAIPIKKLQTDVFVSELSEGAVTVAIDVAKEDMFVAFVDSTGVAGVLRWKHPVETREFVALLKRVAVLHRVEVALEPSGTYGDSLRWAVEEAGLSVFRVSPKRVHDAAEVYDGVPSLHDAKSATLIAKLHRDGASMPWRQRSSRERELAAVARQHAIYAKQLQGHLGRLEALLARHWPELSGVFSKLGRATPLTLLERYGSPAAVAAASAEAGVLMRQTGGHFLSDGKVRRVLDSATLTLGVPTVEAERELITVVAAEARRSLKLVATMRVRLERLTKDDPCTAQMGAVVGKATAAVLVASLGSPAQYPCAAAYRKAYGLNLKEISSGKKKGGLHITKRGPGQARRLLFLASLRLVRTNKVVRAWYDRKVERHGGKLKLKAVIAVMRKLALALWHVGRDAPFDARKLFNTKRLGLT